MPETIKCQRCGMTVRLVALSGRSADDAVRDEWVVTWLALTRVSDPMNCPYLKAALQAASHEA